MDKTTTRPALARASEAAKFLNVSRPYIYKMIAANQIPTKRVGNLIRIPWSWLEEQAKIAEKI